MCRGFPLPQASTSDCVTAVCPHLTLRSWGLLQLQLWESHLVLILTAACFLLLSQTHSVILLSIQLCCEHFPSFLLGIHLLYLLIAIFSCQNQPAFSLFTNLVIPQFSKFLESDRRVWGKVSKLNFKYIYMYTHICIHVYMHKHICIYVCVYTPS